MKTTRPAVFITATQYPAEPCQYCRETTQDRMILSTVGLAAALAEPLPADQTGVLDSLADQLGRDRCTKYPEWAVKTIAMKVDPLPVCPNCRKSALARRDATTRAADELDALAEWAKHRTNHLDYLEAEEYLARAILAQTALAAAIVATLEIDKASRTGAA